MLDQSNSMHDCPKINEENQLLKSNQSKFHLPLRDRFLILISTLFFSLGNHFVFKPEKCHEINLSLKRSARRIHLVRFYSSLSIAECGSDSLSFCRKGKHYLSNGELGVGAHSVRYHEHDKEAGAGRVSVPSAHTVYIHLSLQDQGCDNVLLCMNEAHETFMNLCSDHIILTSLPVKSSRHIIILLSSLQHRFLMCCPATHSIRAKIRC